MGKLKFASLGEVDEADDDGRGRGELELCTGNRLVVLDDELESSSMTAFDSPMILLLGSSA